MKTILSREHYFMWHLCSVTSFLLKYFVKVLLNSYVCI